MLLKVVDLCNNFLKPFEALLRDESITDIWRNGNGLVFVEADSQKRQVDCAIDEKTLVVAIQTIGRIVCNAEICREEPILDASLPDGSRINAAIPPISQPGSQLSIRKFSMRRFSLSELVRIGSVPNRVSILLQGAVRDRESMLIAGGTGSGKTTLLNALVDVIDPDERLCIVEDTVELQAANLKNVVRLKERKEQVGARAVTLRELVRDALRKKPDRIIVGEVRGPEALDLITAMSTGHDGSISTIHANSAEDALDRLTTYCQMAVPLPLEVIQKMVARSLRWVVFMNRKRRLTELLKVKRIANGEFVTEQIECEAS